MTGTLLAALVPVDVESSVYLQAVELLDAHSETYPVKTEIWVCVVTSTKAVIQTVQLTSSRVRLGQSFKTVGCGCTSCWGDVGAGSVEADVFYIPFIVSVQYIV